MQDSIDRAARVLRSLLAEHREEFDRRMKDHIETVATNEADADRLKLGVAEAVGGYLRRHRSEPH